MPGKMKALGTLLLVLAISGCTSPQTISFSPAQDYAISIDKEHIDAVRSDTNDITIFRDDKAIGFLRIEPVPEDIPSASRFLEILRSATEADGVKTETINLPTGFKGFSAHRTAYPTGYLMRNDNAESILVISFPQDMFDKITQTISSGI
jgi:hypothetical protein